jgi:hypothetical protein
MFFSPLLLMGLVGFPGKLTIQEVEYRLKGVGSMMK